MHSKLVTGTLVTLRKQKNKEMKRPALCSGCRRDCLTVEEGAWIRSLAGSKAAARHDPDPCPQIVRLYAKASEPRMERSNRVAELQRSVSITSSWVPHWVPSSTRTT
jgi:hypothetical protein